MGIVELILVYHLWSLLIRYCLVTRVLLCLYQYLLWGHMISGYTSMRVIEDIFAISLETEASSIHNNIIR